MNNSKFNVVCQDILSVIKTKDELIAKQQRMIDRLHGLVYIDCYGDLCLSSESIKAFQKAIEQLNE